MTTIKTRLLALLSCAPLILATGCHKRGSGDDGFKKPDVPDGGPRSGNYLNQMKPYRFADPGCQDAAGSTSFADDASYFLWNGQDRIAEASGLSKLSTEGGLHSAIIDRTLVGSEVEQQAFGTYDPEAGSLTSLNLESEVTLVEEGKPLYFCNPQAGYPEDTYEGIALSGAQFVNQSFGFYEKLTGRVNLEAIDLLVVPDFLLRIDIDALDEDLLFYKTDNASMGGFDRPTMIIYGESTETPSDKPHFWESHFVMAHEFGHHVFASHVSEYFDQSSWQAVLHQHEPHDFAKMSLPHTHNPKGEDAAFSSRLAGGNAGKMSHADGSEAEVVLAFGAFNEGFADLYGSYAMGDPDNPPEGLTDFSLDRQIRSNLFKDQSPKVLSFSALSSFLNQRGSWGDVDFSDNHIIGAIFAHGFDQLVTIDGGGNLSASEKAERLLALLDIHFLKYLNLISFDKVDGELTFVYVVRAMLDSVSDERDGARILSTAECLKASEVFQGLVTHLGTSISVRRIGLGNDLVEGINLRAEYRCE